LARNSPRTIWTVRLPKASRGKLATEKGQNPMAIGQAIKEALQLPQAFGTERAKSPRPSRAFMPFHIPIPDCSRDMMSVQVAIIDISTPNASIVHIFSPLQDGL
jgi:hypothetical protein